MTSKFTKHVVCGDSSVTLSYETSTEDFDQALDEWIKFKKEESYHDDAVYWRMYNSDLQHCDMPTIVDRREG